jgi:tripartite ATP-independent transporter DctM subunit
MLILLLIAVFAVTMVLGVPIAFCLGLGGLAFILLSGVVPIAVLPTLMFSGMDSFPLLAIPFFVIAGDVMQRCGILPKLIAFANSLVGHLRGGLAYVVIITSMMFAGVTGVALAECAAIGSMLAPSMVRQGYPGGFTAAVIAGSAVMGPIIPPSVAMLVFAYVYGGGISVGKLFLMGIVPGVLVGLAMMAFVAVQARRRNFPTGGARFSVRRVLGALRGAGLGLVVPVIILGGILGGAFTPTEAGAVATLYGVVVGVFVLRTLSLSDLRRSLLVGAKTSAVIYLLLGTSNVVSWILVRNQVPKVVAQWSLEFTNSAEVFMLVAIAVLFLLGLALEAVPIMIMLIPILAPAAAAYKIDPHHLGLVVVMAVQTALISPPVALSLYIVASIVKAPMRDANRAIWPFVAVVIGLTVVIAMWPAIPLWIPRRFGF